MEEHKEWQAGPVLGAGRGVAGLMEVAKQGVGWGSKRITTGCFRISWLSGSPFPISLVLLSPVLSVAFSPILFMSIHAVVSSIV